MSDGSLDLFTTEIIRSSLVNTVAEMVVTTTRTAYSTCLSEGEDFTCGLFDASGRMIAQAYGVPVHAGALGDAVSHVIRSVGEIHEGDVFIHNDPYNGGTHQIDGLVLRPIFHQGELLGLAANRGHWVDIGGMAPGGWSGTAYEVIQEGLIIPPIRLVSAATVVEDVRTFLLRNVRHPVALWGDIQAQIASNIVADRRVRELVQRYGVAGYRAAIEAALGYTRRRFATALSAIPDGTAEANDFLEDDSAGNGPFTIRVRITKHAASVVADFTGSDPQASAPVNCTLACTKASVIAALVAVSDPDIPLNAGVTDLVRIIAPRGSLVSPTYPAPTFAATADACDRVAETVLRALAKLAPDRVPAGSYSTGNNLTGSGIDMEARPFLWYSYLSGGCGAHPSTDGNSAEWHLMANCKNESMEVWETRYPVEFLGYRLTQDSGGAGRWRGGLGTEKSWRVLVPTRVSAIADHHSVGAHGVAGGTDGVPNGFALERNGVRRSVQEVFGLKSKSKFANLLLEPGDVLVSIQGGGGGYGDPPRRDRGAVDKDILEGYVSADAANRQYGSRPNDDAERGKALARTRRLHPQGVRPEHGAIPTSSPGRRGRSKKRDSS